MSRLEAVNTFNKGMVMDFNPLTTPDNVLTNCLNGTILTHNGNENILLNDMGNGRVETAYLPEGYVPLGTSELGGIIYIVSYNPLTKKCQIGSFPSPERNIAQDEISKDTKSISNDDFYSLYPDIKTPIVIKKFGDFVLNPGDKFIIYGDTIRENIDNITNYIDLKLATIDNNGRLIYLDNLRTYQIDDKKTIIKDGAASEDNLNLDDYRSIVQSDYLIFTSKVSGNLYIVGLLKVIDSFQTLSWELVEITETEPLNNLIVVIDNSGKYYGIKYTIEFASVNNNLANGVKLGLNNNFIIGGDEISITKDTPSNSYEEIVYYKATPNNKAGITFTPIMEFGFLKYMQENINIDFSLLGTNSITNAVWKYYKDANSMLIKYDLLNNYINDSISKVEITLKDLFTENIFPVSIPELKTYSGINTLTIPFNDVFKENSLFKVTISIEMSSGKLIPDIIHYMYTNGVYNDYWLSLNELNFDNIYLPLTPTISIEEYSNKIPLSYENVIDTNFISLEDPSHFRGKTIYTANNSKNIQIKSGFINDFNSFSLDNLTTSAHITNIEKTIDNNIYNSLDGVNADSEYITILNELYDGETLDINLENNKFTYNINLYSPISADSLFKRIPVLDYYAPIAYTPTDFNKYRIDIQISDTNAITSVGMYTEGPALGMSGGGNDNEGGGGLYYVCGDARLEISGSEFSVEGSPEPGIPAGGKWGITKFPNDDMSNVINRSNPNSGLVPVLLVNAGTSKIKYKNKLYYFLDSSNRGKKSDARVEWFKNSDIIDKLTYIYMLMFIRIRESDNFIPFNYFLRTQLQSSQFTFPNLQPYYSLLCNLYTKRPFNETIGIYTINNISYINRNISITCNINAQADYNPNKLMYNNKPLSEFNIDLNCFKLNDALILDGKLKLNTPIKFNFDISNKYYDTYAEYELTEMLPKYVYGNILPPDDTNYGLYISKNGKLVTPSQSENLPLVTLSISDKGEIIGTPTSTNYNYNNLSILSYDIRNDTICIDNNKITYDLPLTWSSNEDRNNDVTTIMNKNIDALCSITNLPSK